jgi:hypothetical protein
MAGNTTAVRVTRASAAELRKLAYTLSAQTGVRVTLGQALTAAVTLAAQDIPATIAALPERDEEDDE